MKIMRKEVLYCNENLHVCIHVTSNMQKIIF